MGSQTGPSGERVFRHTRAVSFGDCDPAGIVFYPNFYRWFDEAVHVALESIGWGWHRTARDFGWRGVSVVEARAHFIKPALHGNVLTIETRVSRIGNRRIVFEHRIRHDAALICDGTETRFIAVPRPDDPARIQAIDIPAELQAALTVP